MFLAMILIYDIFCMSLPEQDTTKKGRVYEIYKIYSSLTSVVTTPNSMT